LAKLNTSPQARARALVVEDYQPFLDFICAAISECPNTEIVGKAQNGLDGVERALVLQPDLVFLDIGLPGLDGIEAACHIRRLAPRARMIFITQEASPEIVREALISGASGYILKSRSCIDLPVAIEAVLEGGRFVSEGLNGHLV
jgi:DNA-binding NarL/FixJ family response regulator